MWMFFSSFFQPWKCKRGQTFCDTFSETIFPDSSSRMASSACPKQKVSKIFSFCARRNNAFQFSASNSNHFYNLPCSHLVDRSPNVGKSIGRWWFVRHFEQVFWPVVMCCEKHRRSPSGCRTKKLFLIYCRSKYSRKDNFYPRCRIGQKSSRLNRSMIDRSS